MHTLLSINNVSAMVSLSVSQIRRMTKAGTFPKPLKLSANRACWLQEDIHNWINNLQKENSDENN